MLKERTEITKVVKILVDVNSLLACKSKVLSHFEAIRRKLIEEALFSNFSKMTILLFIFVFGWGGGRGGYGDYRDNYGYYSGGDGISNDCPSLRTFARALNIDTKQTGIMAQLNDDCCMAAGVDCTGEGEDAKVVQIDWHGMGLDGVVLNMASLTGLIDIDLSLNSLTGSLPTLPSTLKSLYVNGNLLTGTVPTLPPGLKYIWLGDTADVQSNRFTGTVMINQPIEFGIQGNRITDVIISQTSSLTAGNCVLDNNPLVGSSHIAALNMCSQNGIYSLISTSKKLSSSTSIKTSATVNLITSTLFKMNPTQYTTKLQTSLQLTTSTTTDITLQSMSEQYQHATSTVMTLENLLRYVNESSVVSAALNISENSSFPTIPNTQASIDQPDYLVYYLACGFGLVCVSGVLAGVIFKRPVGKKSKFGRKNSFGTLNTVVTASSNK